ncbi:hypothetical protein [Caballeronia sp. LZ016]|uniref:hypothetical protein n=1 Tax=Caballeronia sp. LZ016 TaxID=3038554 RepID=UPI002854D415|nr:hypothetical protein [Caballeronia sp. LZ016]MDR5737677.1 hypothetical protein [Caballeronia sp. LZ016]
MLAPVLVRAPQLFDLLLADPTLLYAGLADGLRAGPLGGFPPFPTIDPNIAFTSHALGHRAALDVLSGHIPWWNHFEGVGTPLVGEMQAAALFPLTWLLVLKSGQFYMHIALQVISGVATWQLLRRIGCSKLAAVAAALAFEFNGTFAWLANAVINPIPFLPLTLLGIEILRERVARAKAGGHAFLTIGLAASLYAGFPEVAYLNGLLILAWTLVRTAALPYAERWLFLRRVVIGGIAALAISAPVLVPFFDFLPLANTGGHEGTGFESVHLSPGFLVGLLAPYAFGAIFQLFRTCGFLGRRRRLRRLRTGRARARRGCGPNLSRLANHARGLGAGDHRHLVRLSGFGADREDRPGIEARGLLSLSSAVVGVQPVRARRVRAH